MADQPFISRLPGGSHGAATAKAVGLTVVSQVQRRFATSGADVGTWKPLRIRKGQPLRDTGRMMNSINFQVAGPRKVIVGTNFIGGAVHQFGATIRPIRAKALFIPLTRRARPNRGGKYKVDFVFSQKSVIPARPFLALTEANVDEIKAVVVERMNGKG